MPVEEGLVITISADASQVGKGLKDLQAQLKRFQDAQRGAGAGTAAYDRLNRAITETQRRITALNAAQAAANRTLAQGGATAARSGRDYTNLSRVIQDLPFGLMGIQNNLTQLIPGVGMLGLAFSGLISALTFASVGFGAWTRGLDGASGAAKKHNDELKEAREALQDYVDTLNDITKARITGTQSAQKELVDLQTLYNATQNQNISLADRKRLVDELQAQYPKYFGNIQDETILIGGATEAYKKLSAAIISAARTEAGKKGLVAIQEELIPLEQQYADLLAKQVVAQQKFQKAKEAVRKADEEAVKNAQKQEEGGLLKLKRSTASSGSNSRIIGELQKEYNQALEESRSKWEQITTLQDRSKKLAADIGKGVESNPDSLLNPSGNVPKPKASEKQKTEFLFEFLPFDPSGKLKPEQRAQLLDAIDKFSKEFGSVFQGVDFRVQEATEDGALQSAKDWWASYQKGIFQFNPKTFAGDLKIEPPAGAAKDFAEELKERIGVSMEKGLGGFEAEADLGIFSEKSVNEELAKWNKAMQVAQAKAQEYANTVSGILTPALQGMFSAIIQGANPLKSFFDSIGQALQQLIGKLIAAAIQAAILNALLPGGFAIGGNMVKGFGNIFKGLLGFAQGAVVSGPVMAMVGEGRGTSRSNPEIVAPLDKLKGMLGNTGGGFPDYLPVHSISGDTLRLWYARANKKGRMFQ